MGEEFAANIQSVSEIGGQRLRAHSTCFKEEKKSYKHGFGNALQFINIFY